MKRGISVLAFMAVVLSLSAVQPFGGVGSVWRKVYRLTEAQEELFAVRGGGKAVDEAVDSLLRSAAVDSIRNGECAGGALRSKINSLPSGNYLVVWTDGSALMSEMRTSGVLHLFECKAMPGQLEVLLVDTAGSVVPDAVVSVGGRMAESRGDGIYRLRGVGRKPVTACVKVSSGGHNEYFTLSLNRPGRKWRYSDAKAGADIYAKSFLTTDKPEYKPGETMKWKAYVVDRRGRAVSESMTAGISGYFRAGVYKEISLGAVSPLSDGVFTGELLLADSLSLREGASYALYLSDSKGRRTPVTRWQYKDYKLTGVSMTAHAPGVQYRGKDLLLKVKAVDENGRGLPYGSIEVSARPVRVDDIFVPRVVVNDELFRVGAELAPDGDTEILLPASAMPAANMLYACRVTLTDAEMNSHVQTLYINYYYRKEEVIVERAGHGRISVKCLSGGEEVIRDVALYGVTRDGSGRRLLYEGKSGAVLPLPAVYGSVDVKCGDVWTACAVDAYESVGCTARIVDDTVTIDAAHAGGGSFNYAVYCGRRLVAQGCDTAFSMREKVLRREDYTVMLSYLRDGSMYNTKVIARYDIDRLTVDVAKPSAVRPGDSAEVVIRVRDIAGNPVEGVDITALAVTAKFGDSWGRGLDPGAWDRADDGYKDMWSGSASRMTVSHNGGLGAAAFGAFGLQALDYYRFICSPEAVAEHRVPTADGSAQIAPYIVNGGKVLPVVYVMVDWQPVWVGWAASRQPYSFAVKEGRHTVAVRTADKLIAVRNVEARRGEKLMLAINTDGGDDALHRVAVEKMPVRMTEDEKRYFARYMLMPYMINGSGEAVYLKDRKGGLYMLSEAADDVWGMGWTGSVALFGRQGTVVCDKGISLDSMMFFGEAGCAYGFDMGTGGTVMVDRKVRQLPRHMKGAAAEVAGTMCDSALSAESVNHAMRERIIQRRRMIYPHYTAGAQEPCVLHCIGAGDSLLNYILIDTATDSVAAYAGAEGGSFYNLRQGRYALVTLARGGAWSVDTLSVGKSTTYLRTGYTLRYDDNERIDAYNAMMDSVAAAWYETRPSAADWQRMVEALTGTGDGNLLMENMLGTLPAPKAPRYKGAGGSDMVMMNSAAGMEVEMDMEAVMDGIRSAFSDVAYWYPALRTDADGEVRLTVRYPDDLTRWNEYFVAMKGRRRGYAAAHTEAKKDVTGKIYVPQFLIQGDTVHLVGGVANYTGTAMTLVRRFVKGDSVTGSAAGDVRSSLFDTLAVAADSDTLTVAYAVADGAGRYIDGEKRSIGVQPQGMMKSDGEFHVMGAEESVYCVDGDRYDAPFSLHVEGNVLELMRRDAERILAYKFESNDVLAAKLTLLLMMQTDSGLKPLERARNMQKINSVIGKLERNRNDAGLWGWYGRSDKSVWFVSEAVYRALSKAYAMGYEVGTMRDRNYIAYALGEKSFDTGEAKIEAALLMAEMHMPAEARAVYQTIKTDSLSDMAKLKYCLLATYMGDNCSVIDADTLAVRSMTGGLHYDVRGERPDVWRGVLAEDVEATLIMYRRLLADATDAAKAKCRDMRRWLLAQRRYGGCWRNINESIKILDVLMSGTDVCGGKTEFAVVADGVRHEVSGLPFDTVFPAGTGVRIERVRGGELFVGTSVSRWVKEVAASDNEDMSVSAEWVNGSDTLGVGEEALLRVRLTMGKDADYVMVRVPVPAGCEVKRRYGKALGRSYTEYYRDEACMFFEYMPEGEHEFTVTVLNRFAGTFTLNPVQAELFYFPMIGANGEIKKAVIKK